MERDVIENEDRFDEDDAPPLTEEAVRRSIPAGRFFAERGLKPPGRPKSASPKVAVSLRLDRAVVDAFRAGGPGWQTRINAVLAESLARATKRR